MLGIHEAMAQSADSVLFDAAPLALLAVDPENGSIVRANARAAAVLKAGPGELLGQPVFGLFGPASKPALEALLSGACDPGFPAAVALAGASEDELLVACSRASVDGEDVVVLGIVSAVEVASAGAFSIHAGRQTVLSALAEHAARSRGPVWVLFADIDRFRRVVDEAGHIEAERALAAVFQRAAQTLRGSDLLVRFGADELVAVLGGCGSEHEAHEMARAVAESSREPLTVGGRSVRATLSVGVAPARGDEPIEEAVRRAEIAARAAKAEGPGRWRAYDPALAKDAEEARRLSTALQKALEHAEFVLHYQPVVDIRRKAVVGAEALIRWDRPGRGLVMPCEFIGIAEDTGLISDIGAWVIHEACRQIREWSSEGLDSVWVSMNVSARQLRTGEVVEHLAAALADTGVEPARCVLEVTEAAILEDPEVAFEVLEAVRGTGARVALDDFGTGYSSLSRMREMPFNELKIDRSFLQAIDVHARDAALVAAMVALAHSFESSAIAEGVETHDQLSYLKALKCDMAQGYVFSRPVPPSAFASLAAGGPGWLVG